MGSLGEILTHPGDIYLLLKLKMADCHVKKQLPPEPRWVFCYTLLHKASRDFSLVVQQLDTRRIYPKAKQTFEKKEDQKRNVEKMGSLGEILTHPGDIYLLLKLKMADCHVKKQLPPEPRWVFCYTLLHKASRDFSLVVQQLNTRWLGSRQGPPKFLHSNATSHKWALGAFAELLDNSLDEICNGATYVNVDILQNKRDGNKMLLIEDNGGGMDPEKMRQCMSLGYSEKSKIANTIGQYGNGFKTSTMRLGADVIVFSRCSFAVMDVETIEKIDCEKGGQEWNKIIRSYAADWNKNVETIVQWSPFSSEADLLQQFNFLKENGMRIIIYNLWEDDSGQLELDFDTDQQDIHIRGVNRDEKNIQMAKQFPNSRHFLTYRHSLRPFWRLWNAAGSDGRGVIGVLEADFVEPAHDKQGFERTIVLSRLETRLQQMQKTYWFVLLISVKES
ncbi:protein MICRORCHIDIA 7-like [Vitis vinifera]|uniref:protein MICRORCHIDIA 7-like n=1 Tax=Vitis vinifera TaxID=29760 RepID=UPI002882E6AC|nr:protein MICRORCHIDIA 7-like [Vitis vinifera]